MHRLVWLMLPFSGLASAEDPPPSADDIDDFLSQETAPGTPAADPSPPPRQPNAFNPRMTAFGDLLGTYAHEDGEINPASGMWLRSLELDIRADVDPYAKAVAVIALHQEPPSLGLGFGHEAHEEGHAGHAEDAAPGSFTAAPEEVYIDLVSLPAGFSARVGQQRLPVGITNKMHPHDYPWSGPPPGFAEALGPEGLADVAIIPAWRLGKGGLAFTAQGGITAGSAFDPAGTNPAPGSIGRAELFWAPQKLELGLGASTVGLGSTRVDAADLMLRLKLSQWRSIVLLTEAWRPTDGDPDSPVHASATLQVQPVRPLYFGLRGDLVGDDPHAAHTEHEAHEEPPTSAGLSASYYPSEFLRLRLNSITNGHLFVHSAQLTFVWGSHPVEPYWVNR